MIRCGKQVMRCREIILWLLCLLENMFERKCRNNKSKCYKINILRNVNIFLKWNCRAAYRFGLQELNENTYVLIMAAAREAHRLFVYIYWNCLQVSQMVTGPLACHLCLSIFGLFIFWRERGKCNRNIIQCLFVVTMSRKMSNPEFLWRQFANCKSYPADLVRS